MGKKALHLTTAVFLIVFLSGCAFGTRRPILKYAVGTEAQPSKNINIFVDNIKDERTEKDVIGHVRNAYGMKTAKVITNTGIAQWVTDALKSELENIGYTIIEDPSTDISISGEVIEVYVDTFMMYEGKVAVEIALKIDEEEVFRRKYKGEDESINIAATAKSYGITAERALQRALSEATYDIDKAISKER